MFWSAIKTFLVTALEWVEALRVGFIWHGESTKSQGKFPVIRCANSLIFDYEGGVNKIANYLACYLVVKQWLLLETKIQMEGQAKEDVDDDMFLKTNSNFSGMAAHTLEYGALLGIFFTCIGFIFFGTANKL